MKAYIEDHSGIDKSFEFSFEHFYAQVDYDDVNHPEVDAATKLLAKIIEQHWNEEEFKKLFKEEVINIWNKNEYNLQDDYVSLEEYLKEHEINGQ